MQIGGMDPIKLWKTYGQKLGEKFKVDRCAKDLVDTTELPSAFIYTRNPSFTDWIIRSYIRGGIRLHEDIRSRVYNGIVIWNFCPRG